MKAKMEKLLEIFQAMATKQSTPQPQGDTEWPEFGLPQGYTPPEEESDPTQIPVI
ncbi:hypothetical protein A2U01_0104777, partial [Trifolium medium]|nr:hypothetical protein [Trifolium medium]